MEDSLRCAATKLADIRHDATSWRRQVLDEMWALKADFSDEIDEWRSTVPDFVNMAYKDSGFCVPVFIQLLRKFNFPDAEQLNNDLSGSFHFG